MTSRSVASGRRSPVLRPTLLRAFGAFLTVALAGLALAGDLGLEHDDIRSAGLDVAVGVAFVMAAWLAPAPLLERLLVGAVGVAWLAASVIPVLELVPQALLAIALLAYPTGRPAGAARWLLACLALPIALRVVPEPLVGLLFWGIAATCAMGVRRAADVAWYPTLSAAAIALCLSPGWLPPPMREAIDSTQLLIYELVLIVVALTFPLAIRGLARARSRIGDRVLADPRAAGLDGLETVLRDVLRDGGLQVLRWDADTHRYIDTAGNPWVDAGPGRQWYTIADDPASADPVGAVVHASQAMRDPLTASAVEDAVRLAIANARWQDAATSQLLALEEARSRLLAAVDRQRSAIATRLRDEVLGPIAAARSSLSSVSAVPVDDASDAIEIAGRELDAASEGILSIVQGVPLTELGGGRLAGAIRELAKASPLAVSVTTDRGAVGGPEAEHALYYVCSEALTNAVKHARAGRIRIDLRSDRDELVESIADDGIGGADASGSGLQGLADRLAARGGRLRVDSPPGAGTRLTAWIPR